MLSPVVTPADEIARRHYEQQQLLAGRAAAAAADAWQAIDTTDIAASWALQVPQLASTVRATQRIAATGADQYVELALAAANTPVVAAATVVPTSLAGIASDGRPLNSLLVQPAFTSLRMLGAGQDVPSALESGLAALIRMVATQVVDAGRVADGMAMATRATVGYVRMLAPPSCSRCAVLAGRYYRWNAGFLRHPRCDCRHIPVAESVKGDVTVDSRRYFDSLSSREQDEIFTPAGAQAIRDGADLNQVVNARRGMTAAGTTTEGTTRRGFAGKRLERAGATTERRKVRTRVVQTKSGPETRTVFETRVTARLMPEAIYKQARGDRDLALRLLKEHGFIA